MTDFLQRLAVVLIVLGLSYVGLTMALVRRGRRHGSCTCSSVKAGDEEMSGCVCGEKPNRQGEAGS